MSVGTRDATGRRIPARERSSGATELWTWFFMRLSGIVLVFLVLGHFTIVHLIDDGIDRVNFAFVSGRWASPLWQTWDWSMLFLGLLHGANGLKSIIEEYVRRPVASLVVTLTDRAPSRNRAP